MGGVVDTLFGGFSDSDSGGGTADPGHDYGSLWSTYSGWRGEEDRWYTGELARVKSQMSASGVRSGTQGWNDRVTSVDRAYQQRISDLDNTETARILQENWRNTTGGGGQNMLSWYESQYGKSQVAKSGEGDSTGKGAGGPVVASKWLSQDNSDDELWLST